LFTIKLQLPYKTCYLLKARKAVLYNVCMAISIHLITLLKGTPGLTNLSNRFVVFHFKIAKRTSTLGLQREVLPSGDFFFL